MLVLCISHELFVVYKVQEDRSFLFHKFHTGYLDTFIWQRCVGADLLSVRSSPTWRRPVIAFRV